MKKIKNLIAKIEDHKYRLMAAATVYVMVGPKEADAQGIGQMAGTLNTQLANVGNLVVTGCMIGGVGIAGAGLMKLKAAADDGGQRVKYSEGLWRLCVGGGLVALPWLIQTGVLGSVGGGQPGALSRGSVTFN